MNFKFEFIILSTYESTYWYGTVVWYKVNFESTNLRLEVPYRIVSYRIVSYRKNNLKNSSTNLITYLLLYRYGTRHDLSLKCTTSSVTILSMYIFYCRISKNYFQVGKCYYDNCGANKNIGLQSSSEDFF